MQTCKSHFFTTMPQKTHFSIAFFSFFFAILIHIQGNNLSQDWPFQIYTSSFSTATSLVRILSQCQMDVMEANRIKVVPTAKSQRFYVISVHSSKNTEVAMWKFPLFEGNQTVLFSLCFLHRSWHQSFTLSCDNTMQQW